MKVRSALKKIKASCELEKNKFVSTIIKNKLYYIDLKTQEISFFNLKRKIVV